ncbi:MAG: calcium/sodium antiporter [Gemmatimonadota bacterium]
MLLDLVYFVIGLAGLVYGAEWLVGGSARIAAKLGVSSFVVGLTLVSFGTSAPELVVSGIASYGGNGELAVGNVLGSNIANIGLILGLAALIRPMYVKRELVLRDVPIMIGAAAIIPVLAWSGTISRAEGALLLVLFAAYIGFIAVDARRQSSDLDAVLEREGVDVSERNSVKRDAAIAIVGLVVLAVGANLMVDSAIAIATELGVSQVVIGLTLVALGTSLPELAASVSAARRDEGEIVIGNIVGSNIFNVALILGVSALIRPLPISATVLRIDAPVVIALSLLFVPLMFTSLRIHRWEGGFLVACYLSFIAFTAL